MSVIIVTYNRLPYLGESLASVVKQEYRPIELIVVDDGSVDGTPVFLEAWKAQYTVDMSLRVQVLRQSNLGATAARNTGLRACSGEFIQFLDSDDALHPEKLRRHVACLQASPSLMLAYGSTVQLGTASAPTPYFNGWLSPKESVRRCITGECGFFCTPTALFRRQAVEQLGPWDEGLTMYDDVDYGGRLFCRDLPYEYMAEAVCYLRAPDGRQQLTSPPESRAQAQQRARGRSVQLQNLWHLLPRTLRDDVDTREELARAVQKAARSLCEVGLKDHALQLGALARTSAVGTRFNLQAALFDRLTRLGGVEWASRVYGGIESSYSLLLRWSGRR